MFIKVGDQVEHPAFGTGTVRGFNPAEKTVLVRWDTHQVDRETPELARNESHVNVWKLTLLTSPGD